MSRKSHKSRTASIDNQTLDQLVDMAVESVGGDPSNADFTPALEKARDKWHNAVERELTKWVSKNLGKFDLDSRPFHNLRDDADVDDIVEVLLELRGGAGYLYFMEMEGHGVGTWDGDWDQLFVDGGRGVNELSKHMERAVSREYRDLKNEIEDIAMGSIPEDEDGYDDDDRYSGNRYASRRASRTLTAADRKRLIKMASTMPVGSPERKAVLKGLSKSASFAWGLQSKGLKAVKLASDSPLLMPVQGKATPVMPANGTDFKLREVQKMVGGYVEVVYLRDGRIMLADEEGLLKGLPLNRAASRMAGRPIVGPALVMPNDMFR